MEIIYDGIAKSDHLVAASVYLPRDFSRVFGSKSDYGDYLIYRFRKLVEIDPPANIIEFPFDYDLYDDWLKQNAEVDSEENRCLWAVEVAKNKEVLEYIKLKHPVMPREPSHEETTLFIGYIPATTHTEVKILPEIFDKIINLFPPLPAFKRLSLLRSSGVVILVGDSFAGMEGIQNLTEYLMDYVNRHVRIGAYDGKKVEVVKIPFRFKARNKTPDSPVFLPILICGASHDVQYCRELLVYIPDVCSCLIKYLFGITKPIDYYPMIPWDEIDSFRQYCYIRSNNVVLTKRSRKFKLLTRIK